MKHIKGDIFNSSADAILHQVNCQGVMGAGVAKQVKEKFPTVFRYYKALCDEDKRMRKRSGQKHSNLLGRAQVCCKEDYLAGQVEDSQVIVNLFAQDKYGRDGRCYTDYEALKKSLKWVNHRFSGKSIAIPYLMGCGLAGGDWNVVSKLIENTLIDCNVILYEYCKEKELVDSVDDVLCVASLRSAESVSEKNDVDYDIVKE